MAMRRREHGHVVVFALWVAMLLSMAAMLLSSLLLTEHRAARRELVGLRLKALADATIAEAVAAIAGGSTHGAGEHELGEGRIASEVRQLGPTSLEILGTATFRDVRRRVRAVVDISGPSPRVVSFQVLRRSELVAELE